MAKVSQVQARHNARIKAMQALYRWDISDPADAPSLQEIEDHFLASQEMQRVDINYWKELLHGVPAKLDVIDEHLAQSLDRPIDDLDVIERSVCRIGAYELLERLDIPVRVVINECLEVTKKFGADQGHKYVNGVMDKLAQQIRSTELGTRKKY